MYVFAGTRTLTMWFLDAKEKTLQPKKQGLLLTTGVEYVVGRKDCTLLIQDDASISRKHSVITMLHDETKLGDSSKISQVFLQDFSKYGTFVNGAKISGTVTLKDGDKILFGKNNSYYRIRYTPLVVVTSCLDDKKKKQLKSHILKLGGHMISDWCPNLVTHLVMDELTFTIKVIHALAECCPVVKPSYFDDIANAASTSLSLAKVESYLPPLKEETISSQGERFLPREARRTLFSGKTFVFISKKQFKRVHHAVKSSGGIALLRDTPGSESNDGLVSKDVCVMMIDSKEQNALPAECQQWVLHVMETLRRHRCRPIPESELGLALLFVSLNNYCNPSITAVPPLTQSLVSQSFQAMDVSQQIAPHETQFKKPSTPVKHAKEDKNQGGWCETQNLAYTTVQKSSKTLHFGKRCTSEDEVVESVLDSQTDSQDKPPSTKRRKVVEENLSTCSETPLVCESLDANKSPIESHRYKQLELTESIVAESLEVGHDVSIELNGQSKGKLGGLHEQENKLENIADSLDVSAHSDVAIGEAVGCVNKERKTYEHSRFSVSEVQFNEKDREREGRSNEKINSQLSHQTANKCDDKMDDPSDIHVPAGFLCSGIPTKLNRNTVFQDEEANIPRNLLVVDQVSLVVRPFDVLPILQKRPEDTTIKNFKRFRKQFYPGSRISLPRIIGGSDLVVYQSCERLDKEDWFVEAREADAERQKEERRAEELFRWEETRPTKSRRIRR